VCVAEQNDETHRRFFIHDVLEDSEVLKKTWKRILGKRLTKPVRVNLAKTGGYVTLAGKRLK